MPVLALTSLLEPLSREPSLYHSQTIVKFSVLCVPCVPFGGLHFNLSILYVHAIQLCVCMTYFIWSSSVYHVYHPGVLTCIYQSILKYPQTDAIGFLDVINIGKCCDRRRLEGASWPANCEPRLQGGGTD